MTTSKVCGKGKCKFTDEFCVSGDCPYDPDVLKNNEDFNILEGYVKMDNPLYTSKLPEPKDFTISFQFKDGEEAVFKEAKSLQDFIDKMNNLHELEKENMKFKKLLIDCKNLMNDCIRGDYKNELCERIDEVLK